KETLTALLEQRAKQQPAPIMVALLTVRKVAADYCELLSVNKPGTMVRGKPVEHKTVKHYRDNLKKLVNFDMEQGRGFLGDKPQTAANARGELQSFNHCYGTPTPTFGACWSYSGGQHCDRASCECSSGRWSASLAISSSFPPSCIRPARRLARIERCPCCLWSSACCCGSGSAARMPWYAPIRKPAESGMITASRNTSAACANGQESGTSTVSSLFSTAIG